MYAGKSPAYYVKLFSYTHVYNILDKHLLQNYVAVLSIVASHLHSPHWKLSMVQDQNFAIEYKY